MNQVLPIGNDGRADGAGSSDGPSGGGGGGGGGAVEDLVRSLTAELKKKETQLRKQETELEEKDAELALFRAEAGKDNQIAFTNTDADSNRVDAQQLPPQRQELPKVYYDGDAALASARRGVQQVHGHGNISAVHQPRALERQETTEFVNAIGETETHHRNGRVDIITPSGRHYQEE